MGRSLVKRRDNFIDKATKKYNNFYNYDNIKYINFSTKITIKCPVHGNFDITPNNHLGKYGRCNECVKSEKLDELQLQFIYDSCSIHNNKYDYSLVEYSHSKVKVSIICPEHGLFKMRPNNHLRGQGCSECHNLMTSRDYIKMVSELHNNKFKYKIIGKYINRKRDTITIICPKHGQFKQSARGHERGYGCNECGNDRKRNNVSELIRECNIIHNNKYDYSLVSYQNMNDMVKIICPEHGVYDMSFRNHLYHRYGCGKCSSSRGERMILNYLNTNNIAYYHQHKFSDLYHINHLVCDFYLPEHNLVIEYNGKQHYEPVEFYGGESTFNVIQIRDNIKKEYCDENGINFLVIKYNELREIDSILESIL